MRQLGAFRDLARIIMKMMVSLNMINSILIFATAALIWLWSLGELSVGAIAIANALVIRLFTLVVYLAGTIALFAGRHCDGDHFPPRIQRRLTRRHTRSRARRSVSEVHPFRRQWS